VAPNLQTHPSPPKQYLEGRTRTVTSTAQLQLHLLDLNPSPSMSRQTTRNDLELLQHPPFLSGVPQRFRPHRALDCQTPLSTCVMCRLVHPGKRAALSWFCMATMASNELPKLGGVPPRCGPIYKFPPRQRSASSAGSTPLPLRAVAHVRCYAANRRPLLGSRQADLSINGSLYILQLTLSAADSGPASRSTISGGTQLQRTKLRPSRSLFTTRVTSPNGGRRRLWLA